MGIFYPIRGDSPDDVDLGFEDFASELSDQWIVAVSLVDEDGEETDPVAFGPYPPARAWELGNELDERVPSGINVELAPIYSAPDAAEILSEVLPSPAPTVDS